MTTETSGAAAEGSQQGTETVAGKHLTFELDGEVYGIGILKVQEIIGMMNVTKVPRTPDFVRGVINLRGKVIPVVDLRLKFGMEGREDTERTCIIVVQVERENVQVVMGVLVDEVSEVLDVSADQVEPPPSFGTSVDTAFLRGMAKIGDKVVMMLDVDHVLSGGEVAMASEIARSASQE